MPDIYASVIGSLPLRWLMLTSTLMRDTVIRTSTKGKLTPERTQNLFASQCNAVNPSDSKRSKPGPMDIIAPPGG